MNMKIRPEHYEYLKNAIATFPPVQEHGILKLAREYHEAGLSEVRFRWDLLYSLKLSTWISDNLYPYLHDPHIDTALRKIVGELA